APNAYLYSRFPHTSQWPTRVTLTESYFFSQASCRSSVWRASCDSSLRSSSKNTRSPTFCARSCSEPGITEPPIVELSVATPSVCAPVWDLELQPATNRDTARAPTIFIFMFTDQTPQIAFG